MKIIIIDDTPSAVRGLTKKLAEYPDTTVVGTANNGADGLKLLKKNDADVLFLDVEMPDMSGISFLSKMKKDASNRPLTVIYTAYNTYALPALRNKAFDFLLKPIDDKEMDGVMKRLDEELESIAARAETKELPATSGREDQSESARVASVLRKKDDKLLLYTNTVDFRLIDIKDICGFQYNHDLRVWEVIAAGCKTPVRLKRCANKDILMALDERFVQVNQKYIINIRYLMEVRDNQCLFFPPFDDITYIKIGRMYRRKLIKRFNTL